MAKPTQPTSYERLGQRIQRVINSPKAQSQRCAEISKAPDESNDDWRQLLEELGTLGHVTMIPLDESGEHIRLRWNPEESMA
ncbi:DUF1654 domain-containing protein [Halomonas sp. ZH2S]|uniref:DUF1654 domain-containing protein n=1 Tax=Vreelandella zhuhanensis TaxID=2684210 RepID=A0A7X3GXI0_9GAMM|nr:DUF1654 domain-containing protein [Halomonas zhuhanensis]MWJ26722.1 DUF1654 domain-containing protein [Halomonas zhuhanensis]